MNGKILENGCLVIERPGPEKTANCPNHYDDDGTQLACGDWCVQFGEPKEERKFIPGHPLLFRPMQIKKTGRIVLEICHSKTLIFDNFEDGRGK